MDFDTGISAFEQPRKPTFEKDFIMLSEFSELVGPVPLCFIPEERAKGNFNTNHFSVRIMSSDFQAASGKVVAKDTQIIISEKQECAYAYVHYFSLKDNNARGYVRQYALSYITSSSSKIIDNFEDLLKQFGKVTAFLKASNHILYLKDMSRHLADLELTMSLLHNEGWTDSTTDPNQLYTEFDFAKEDVPERDPAQVLEDMKETKEIIASMNSELAKEETKKLLEDLNNLKELKKKQKSRDRANTYPLEGHTKGESGFTSYLQQPVTPDSMTRMSIESLSLSSSGSNEYEPQRVMTHLVHKFERRLRTLEELAPRACSIAMDRLHEIHKFFSRSELALEMEKEEMALLTPRSSLLTIGRVPVLNVLQDYSPHPQDPPPPYDPCPWSPLSSRTSVLSTSDFLHQATPYRISSRNTWGMPAQSGEGSVRYVEGELKSGFDTIFVEDKVGLKQYPLYVDSTYFPGYRLNSSESYATEPPNYESTLVLSTSTSKLDTDSETNLLSVRQDEDDGASSTTFATPTAGSDEEEEEGGAKHRDREALEEGVSGFRASPKSSPKVRRSLFGEDGNEPDTQFLGVPAAAAATGRGSLEVSGESSSYLRSESGSQCTLTDSREATFSREATLVSTDLVGTQAKQGGGTTPMNSTGGVIDSMPPNGVMGTDGASMSSIRNKYPDLPPHMLSINSQEPQEASEIVIFKPPVNGHCRTGGYRQHVEKGVPVVLEESQPVAVGGSPGVEESFSAGHKGVEPTAAGGGNQQGDNQLQGGNQQEGVNRPLSEPPCPPSGSSPVSGPVLDWNWAGEGPLQSTPGGNPQQGSRASTAGPSQGQTSAGGNPLQSSPAPSLGVSSAGGNGVPAGPVLGAADTLQLSQLREVLRTADGPLPRRPHPTTTTTTTTAGRSPVDSVGTASSSTSDELPVLVGGGGVRMEEEEEACRMTGGGGGKVRTKDRGAMCPPPDLHFQTGEQQVSPDVYHTPLTNFAPNSSPFFMGGPPKPLQQQQQQQQQQQRQQHRYFSPPSSSHEDGPGPHYPFSPTSLSPSQRSIASSIASITSMDTVFDKSVYKGLAVLEGSGDARLPLMSTVDHIEGQFKFKPGKGIINFCKNTPVVTDMLYCLLQGRPLVLLGKPTDENVIRRLIRVLWLFVPGHSSQRQVITWQETPLDARDLSRVKLIGLCNKSTQPIGPHIKPYVSYWDCSSGKLWTPSYTGELLKPIVSRTKDKKNEEVFLTHIHSVLMEIAMKAFVYYHGYCISLNGTKRSPTFELSPRKCHTVISDKAIFKKLKMAFLQKLGIKNSDVDIIEYFVDVIREQQLAEWGLEGANGSPFDEEPVRMHLQTKRCTDSFCKPKRPY